jgi:hypothetical protein
MYSVFAYYLLVGLYKNKPTQLKDMSLPRGSIRITSRKNVGSVGRLAT